VIFAPIYGSTFEAAVRETLVKADFGNSDHSHESTDDWNNIATERLHPLTCGLTSEEDSPTERALRRVGGLGRLAHWN